MNTLSVGASLRPGKSITSLNGKFALTLQVDGNLVLYPMLNGNPSGPALFNTQTTRGNVAIMQEDGNFVLYDPENNAIWLSGTSGHWGNPYVIIQNDGNLVIYATPSLWDSGTAQK